MAQEPGMRPRSDDVPAVVLDVHHAVALDAQWADAGALQQLARHGLHRVSPELGHHHGPRRAHRVAPRRVAPVVYASGDARALVFVGAATAGGPGALAAKRAL